MKYLNLLISLFIIYIPIYLVTLLSTVRKNNKKYSFYTNSISHITHLKKPYSHYFNILTSTYGALSIFTIVKFYQIAENNIFIDSICMAYGLISLSTFLVGFFPLNFNKKKHNAIAVLLFISLLIFETLFILILGTDKRFLIPSIFATILTIFTALLLYKAKEIDREEDYAIYEWIVFIGTLIWNLAFSFIILNL